MLRDVQISWYVFLTSGIMAITYYSNRTAAWTLLVLIIWIAILIFSARGVNTDSQMTENDEAVVCRTVKAR